MFLHRFMLYRTYDINNTNDMVDNLVKKQPLLVDQNTFATCSTSSLSTVSHEYQVKNVETKMFWLFSSSALHPVKVSSYLSQYCVTSYYVLQRKKIAVRSGIRTHASRGDCDLNAAP